MPSWMSIASAEGDHAQQPPRYARIIARCMLYDGKVAEMDDRSCDPWKIAVRVETISHSIAEGLASPGTAWPTQRTPST